MTVTGTSNTQTNTAPQCIPHCEFSQNEFLEPLFAPLDLIFPCIRPQGMTRQDATTGVTDPTMDFLGQPIGSQLVVSGQGRQ